MQVLVSPPDFADWPALLGLLRSSFAYMEARIDPPSSLTRMEIADLQAMARRDALILAVDGTHLLGCAFASLRDDCVYVGKLAVKAESRGRGVARRIMAAAESIARRHGKPFLELQTRVELVENHAAFGALGFVKVGESAHPGYDRPTSITMHKPVGDAEAPPMPASIAIVPFAPEHAEGVFAVILPIQQDEFGIAISRAEQTDLADIPGFYRKGAGNFWVALDRERVVGTIGLFDIGEGVGVLRKMFVAAPYRGHRQGAGQRLLDTLLEWAARHGFRRVVLGTTVKYLAAHRFYEKNGFREVDLHELPAAFPRLAVDTKFYSRSLAAR